MIRLSLYNYASYDPKDLDTGKTYGLKKEYTKAWSGELQATSLDGAFFELVRQHDVHASQADILEVTESDDANIIPGFYYTNRTGFERIPEANIDYSEGFTIIRDGQRIVLTDHELELAADFYKTAQKDQTPQMHNQKITGLYAGSPMSMSMYDRQT